MVVVSLVTGERLKLECLTAETESLRGDSESEKRDERVEAKEKEDKDEKSIELSKG
uniref:Uncharacterized protein n=1 Tax=Nelumbo nucifera TaxID=4432 RepID=A0A822YG39_NELNU|nr:TPA_asm: hypothetical protein HUJ06_010308 [Nelumbo nucifera]